MLACFAISSRTVYTTQVVRFGFRRQMRHRKCQRIEQPQTLILGISQLSRFGQAM